MTAARSSAEGSTGRPVSRRASFLGSLALAVVAVSTVSCALELALRHRDGPPGQPSRRGYSTLDPNLGWRAREEFTLRLPASGGERPRMYRTDPRGFRAFGDLDSGQPRVFFVGDSFTQAADVESDEAYYSVFGATLGTVQVFAYGCGGYGSLQELLILERFLPLVKPSVVVWQFTSNDFINNSLALERRSTQKNNLLPRPYLEADGRVERASPAPYPAWVLEWAYAHSRLAVSVLWRVHRLRARVRTGVEDIIQARGEAYPPYRQSVLRTREILRQARARVGAAHLVVFTVDDDAPFFDSLRALLAEEDIHFVPGVPGAVQAAEAQGHHVMAQDGWHWNEHGHSVCGRHLATVLREDERSRPFLVGPAR